jgi:hypothetical protein
MCAGRRPSTAARPLVGRRQGRFARPVDAGRVATGVWVWASVRSRGTGGHHEVPAFVPGRPTRPNERDVMHGRGLARFKFKIALFDC